MLRYRAYIWEYTIEIGIGTPSIKQIVGYFYSNHDNKQYSLEDGTGEEKSLQFNFTPVKVWEMKKDSIIQEKLVGLYTLLPLVESLYSELIKKFVGKSMLMNSPIYNEWVEEERKEAAEKAAIKFIILKCK